MSLWSRLEAEELDREDYAMFLWLYRRCDDGFLSDVSSDLHFWWGFYVWLSAATGEEAQ